MISPAPSTPRQQIVCVGFWPDYEEYFWQKADSDRFDVSVLNIKKNSKWKFLFKISPKPIREYIFKKVLNQEFSNKHNAIFIFQ